MVQLRLAEAAAAIEAASLMLETRREQSLAVVASGRPITWQEVLRNRRDLTFGMQQIRAAVQSLVRAVRLAHGARMPTVAADAARHPDDRDAPGVQSAGDAGAVWAGAAGLAAGGRRGVSGPPPAADGTCLIVTNKFPPMIGGAGNIYASLARASAGRIHVLCAWRDYASGSEVPDWRAHDAASGIHVHRIRDIRPGLTLRSGLLPRVIRVIWQEPMIRLGLLLRVAALRVRYGVRAVCVADDETVGWLMRPAQRLLRCRVGLFCHGDDLAERAGEERTRERRRRQFRLADAIVASSEAAAADLGRVFGVPRDRITIISNGVDTVRYRPLPPDPALIASLGLEGKRAIATVARLVPRKGVDQVLRAVARLRNEFPKLHYLVVGDDPTAADCSIWRRVLGVADCVRFAGQVPADNVPRYLARGGADRHAARQEAEGEDEGTPLVSLEANACGKPVIAGRTGGGPDLVAHGVNGLCIDGADADAVTDAIRRLLADPAWGREGRRGWSCTSARRHVGSPRAGFHRAAAGSQRPWQPGGVDDRPLRHAGAGRHPRLGRAQHSKSWMPACAGMTKGAARNLAPPSAAR